MTQVNVAATVTDLVLTGVAREDTQVEVRDAINDASTAIVAAITLARTTQSTAMAAALTELDQKLEPADITALATAANQTTQTTALGNLLTELAQKLEPGDLASLATAAHQVTTDGKLDALLTELAQKLEPADLAALSTAANQVTENTKLDSLLTELGQKLEPADIALLSTAAKQDAAKAVLDAMSTTLSNIAGYVDGLEAAEASNLAKLELIRLLLAGTLSVGSSTATASNDASVVATGTGSASLVAAKSDRIYLLLVNTGTSDVWVSLGGTAVVGEGIPLWADGGAWEMPTLSRYTGAVNAIGALASTVAVTEY